MVFFPQERSSTLSPAVRDSGFVHDDGGRAAAGFRGQARDCVARSVAIASGLPYAEVYATLASGTGSQRTSSKGRRKAASARHGVDVRRKWFRDYMEAIGFRWVPAMTPGSGCRVHLDASELPSGRLVVSVSRHMTAMVDGVIRDTSDPRRLAAGIGGVWGRRCVYGYWVLEAANGRESRSVSQ